MHFPTASFRTWTQVTNSISYNCRSHNSNMQNKQEQHLPVQHTHSLDQQPTTAQRMD